MISYIQPVFPLNCVVYSVHSLELELSERGYSLDYINIIYVGGGALMAKDYAGKYRSHTAYDCDLCANAKGYEFLASQMMGKRVG